MRPKNKNYATSLRKYATSVKKYATNIKKMPPFYGRNRIFQRKFFNFFENFTIFQKKKMLPAAEIMLPKQKLCFLCFFFLEKPLSVNYALFVPAQLPKGFYATYKKNMLPQNDKLCYLQQKNAKKCCLRQKISY